MSSLRPRSLPAAPLRVPPRALGAGNAAEMRLAKIWANRSAKASNGCEERLAISLHYAKAGSSATYERLSRHHISKSYPPTVIPHDPASISRRSWYPCWLQISSARGDLAQVPSSDTPIVVMEPTEYGDCVDAAVCLERPSNRLLVPEGLVRTRFVAETDVLVDDASEVILTQDENVVEHLSAERTGEAFSEGIHLGRTYRRAHHAHPRRSEYASEPRAELRIVVADDHLRYAIHGGVPGVLRAPLVGRCIRHRAMEDRPATQVQE